MDKLAFHIELARIEYVRISGSLPDGTIAIRVPQSNPLFGLCLTAEVPQVPVTSSSYSGAILTQFQSFGFCTGAHWPWLQRVCGPGRRSIYLRDVRQRKAPRPEVWTLDASQPLPEFFALPRTSQSHQRGHVRRVAPLRPPCVQVHGVTTPYVSACSGSSNRKDALTSP